MEHEELTHRVIGCASTMFNKLGHGFLESVYERAMMIELARAGWEAACQANITVRYDDMETGCFTADIVVNDVLIVELKAIEKLARIHEVRLVNYLVATGKPIGLLLNLGPRGVEVKRKHRTPRQD